MDRWLQSFRAELETADLLRGVRRLVIGVSGGADSVCLLELFHEWVREIDPALDIMVGHVHHGIRGTEADRDAEFVQGLAEERGLPFLYERGAAAALDAEGGISLEMAARRVRFDAFRTWVRDHALDAVALGHHLDDQAETVLLRAMRGSGLRGLGGIPRRRNLADGDDSTSGRSPPPVVIIRPLLAWPRSRILSFVAARGLAAREDSSNADRSIPRNRLRSEILPALERVQPGATASLVRLGELARRSHADLRELAERAFDEARAEGGGDTVVFDADALARWPDSVLHEVLALALGRVAPPDRVRRHAEVAGVRGVDEYGGVFARKPFTGFLRAMVEWLRGGKRGAKVIELGSGAAAELRYGKVRIRVPRPRPESEHRDIGPVVVCPPSSPEVTARARWGGWEFSFDWHALPPGRAASLASAAATRCRTRRGPSQEEPAAEECAELFDLDVLESSGPLHVRERRTGDVFHPLGAPGRKKLKEFFRQCEVAPDERRCVPLFASGETIQWVVGYRIGHRARCRRGTRRVLKVRARRLPVS